MLPADDYERVLQWFDEQAKTYPIDLKATCAHRIAFARSGSRWPGAGATPPIVHRARHAGESGPDAVAGRPFDGAQGWAALVRDDAGLPGRNQRLLRFE
jgi:hypothetical protein